MPNITQKLHKTMFLSFLAQGRFWTVVNIFVLLSAPFHWGYLAKVMFNNLEPDIC